MMINMLCTDVNMLLTCVFCAKRNGLYMIDIINSDLNIITIDYSNYSKLRVNPILESN